MSTTEEIGSNTNLRGEPRDSKELASELEKITNEGIAKRKYAIEKASSETREQVNLRLDNLSEY